MDKAPIGQMKDSRFIDENTIHKFQNQYCQAGSLFMVCMDPKQGPITRLYGTEEQREFLHQYVDESHFLSLVKRLEDSPVEHILYEELEVPFLRMCGVSTNVDGKTQVVWISLAIIGECLPAGLILPEGMWTLTAEQFEAEMGFLEYITRFGFAVKMDEMIASEAIQAGEVTRKQMELQLSRFETMTQILTLLESDNGFAKIVDDILRLVCQELDISEASLLRENSDGSTVDMICEYAMDKEHYEISSFQGIPKERVPFFTGKPYMLSSDSMRPESFASYMNGRDVTAAIYQPVEISGKNVMYLSFQLIGKERVWDVTDLKFINDVKQVVQSILTKRIAKNSLASSYASLEAILENVGCGIYVLDPNTKSLLYTNQKFKELFEKSISSGKINQILFSEQELRNENYFREVFSPEEQRWLDVHKTHIKWVDGRSVVLCTIYDITDKKLYQKKIESQANNDFLTGLYNRMRCEQDLDRYIRNAELEEQEGALLYFDIDDFKHINEGLGHQYGDILLKAVSHSLQRINGIESTCYRMGGDEFIVIVTDTKKFKVDTIVSQISEIFSKPWFLKGEDYYCTMSMGVVNFPTDAITVEDVIRKADMALYTAKKDGKNRVEYYNGKDVAIAHRRLDMEKNLRKATLDACREFEVYYQPIMNVKGERDFCCGAEALIRWNSVELGFISPADFIPLAEYLGLINPIGDFVLFQAAKRCRYWNEMGHPDYKVNVNLSVVQLLQNDIVKKVRQVIEDTHINPHNLCLEVTESLAINDIERMKNILGQMRELGCRVALDDFGTGYSSLNHIRELPIDIIKIDRCFVEHIAEDDFSDAFVKMVTELANTLGVDICTEGVEDTRQYEKIKARNISMIQGYYFNKPLKIDDFEEKYL